MVNGVFSNPNQRRSNNLLFFIIFDKNRNLFNIIFRYESMRKYSHNDENIQESIEIITDDLEEFKIDHTKKIFFVFDTDGK